MWQFILALICAFLVGFALGAILIATTSKQSIKNKTHSAIKRRIRIVESDLDVLFDEYTKNPDECDIPIKIYKTGMFLGDIRNLL